MDIDPNALRRNDPEAAKDTYAGLPWNHHARFSGIPGMVWYATVQQVRGDKLQVGQWLDSLDHRGARAIMAIHPGATSDDRTVEFSFGDTETVRCDVEYDVVDPNSQVTPDGTPVATD